jgi:Lecithin:cholesterol acyltransferase
VAIFFKESFMDTIIFLPGGGGSCLQSPSGDEVWPPTALEFLWGYGRIQQFLEFDLVPSGIVDSIPLNQLLAYQVYRQILQDLFDIQDNLNTQNNLNIEFVPFAYDFRKDVLVSAQDLQATIENCYNNGSRSIALVCHSTGNQVARAVLENPRYQSQGWFQSLNTYVGICGPHFGVPVVLEYALGLSGWLSISETDMQTFSRDGRYPGCYQLLPYHGYDVQYDVLNDTETGAEDFYQASIAAKFYLDPNNLGNATALQQALNFQNKPANVNYELVAAYGHPTDQTINYNDLTFDGITSTAPGDGTVPLWSAAPPQMNAFTTPGDHFSVMTTYAFRDHLWMLLTGEHAPFFLFDRDVDGVTISLDSFTYLPGDQISILVIPDQPTEQISGTLTIEKASDDEAREFKTFSSQPFSYQGPSDQFIHVNMAAPGEPGTYRMSLTGRTHATAPQAVPQFAVSPKTGRRAKRRTR